MCFATVAAAAVSGDARCASGVGGGVLGAARTARLPCDNEIVENQPFTHLAAEDAGCGEADEADAAAYRLEHFRAEQLKRGIRVLDFWTTKSVHELAEEQGVSPVTDIDELSDDTITEAEATAFMEALGL